MNEMTPTPPLHALLIGVDAYSHPDWRDLGGCVNDVVAVDAYLTGHLGVDPARITRLLAPRSDLVARDLPEAGPVTYEAMVDAIRGLARRAEPGSPVYIHYSGHGGRLPTIVPDVKGAGAQDECLVPPDGGEPGCRYLRDVELGTLLQELTDAGLVVTLVLDSCHSGGGIRGGVEAVPRSVGDIAAPASTESAVGTTDELAAAWLRLRRHAVRPGADDGLDRGSGSRAMVPGSGWMPAADYTFLAACLETQQAYEDRGEDGRFGGIFTHRLLDLLYDGGTELSYRRIYPRLLARVNGTFSAQTPVIEGNLDRKVLGLDHLPARCGIPVLQVNRDAGRVTVAAGRVHGLAPGARLETGSDLRTEGSETGRGRIEIETVELVRSTGRPAAGTDLATVSEGDLAVVVDPGTDLLRRAVRVVPDGADEPGRRVLEGLAERIRSEDAPFLVPASADRPADFLVGTREGGVPGPLAVLDEAGEPVHGLPRHLAGVDPTDPDAVDRLLDLLRHLAHYENVRRLENPDASSPLAGRLELELGLLPEDWSPGPAEGVPDGPLDELPYPLPVGRWVRFRLRNRSPLPVYATVLDLRPDWSVAQLFPLTEWQSPFLHLAPGEEFVQALRADLPEGFPEDEGDDILQVVASVEILDCQWLQASPPGAPVRSRTFRSPTRGPENRLEELLEAVGSGRPSKGATRFATAGGSGVGPWATVRMSVPVARAGSAATRRPAADRAMSV